VKIIRTMRLKRHICTARMANASIEEIHSVRSTAGMVLTPVFQKYWTRFECGSKTLEVGLFRVAHVLGQRKGAVRVATSSP